MGLFTSLFSLKGQRKPSSPREVAILMGAAKFDMEILVEDQTAFEAICEPRLPMGINRYETAWLYLDNKNPKDKNAVAVVIRERLVGYLNSEAAKFYRQHIIAKGMPTAVGECQAVIRGGWVSSDGRKGPYQVWLDLPRLYPFSPVQ
jgi:hypothetical protein